MSSSLIITEAIIDDSDLCLPQNNQLTDEEAVNHIEDQIEEEEEEEESDVIVLSLDEKAIEERQQMLALGLPQEFTSSRGLNKRSKKKKNKIKYNNDSKMNEDSIAKEDLNELFSKYWLQFGYDIVSNSWFEKYSKYLSSSDATFEDKSEQLNNEFSSNEAIDENESKLLWQQLWDNHYLEEYEIEFNKFVNNSQQNFSSDEFKFLPQMLTSVKIEDNYDPNEQTSGKEDDKTSSQPNEVKTEEVNESKPTCSGSGSVLHVNSESANNGSDGEEPPDERPTVIKRQHEYDSMDNLVNDSNVEKQVNETQKKSLVRNKKRKSKYWHQRYRLFSRFDEGIKLDNESWYSVTPERIAEHIAHRFSNSTNYIIIDAFCGSGGNTIQFALISNSVKIIAIDIDRRKIEFAKHNAQIYGVSDRIEFIIGDYMQLAKSCAFKADAVFLSPPWGGPKYLKKDKYKLDMMSPNGIDIFNVTKQNICPNIGFLLPRNIDKNELIEVAGEGNSVEVEQNLLNNKVKTVTAYFGNLIKSNSVEVS